MKNLSVLITRPQPQADELAHMIRQQGGRAVVFPAFTIQEPLDKNALRQAIEKLSSADWAIFVSSNAVNFFVNAHVPFEKGGSEAGDFIFSPPPAAQTARVGPLFQRGREHFHFLYDYPRCAAVGKSTQAALKKYGITAISPEKDFSSETLLDLPEFQNVAHQKIMIFQGETGRGLLQQVLQERGAQVETVIAYRRVKSESVDKALLQLWQHSHINAMVYTSAEGMLNFFECVDPQYHPWLKSIPSLVVSNRLAEIARSINIETIIKSDGASNSEILRCLANPNVGWIKGTKFPNPPN